MGDRTVEAFDVTADMPEAAVKPYSWPGIAFGLIALLALTILICLALVPLVFVAEIPIEGWHVMSARAAWCYQIVREGHADFWIPHRLLIGALAPVTPHVVRGYLLVSMLPQLSGMAAVFVLARFHAGSRWRDLLAWRPWSFRRNALMFVILLVVVVTSNIGAGLVASHFVAEAKETLPSLGLAFVLLSALESIVFAPYLEELVMRGWLYTALRMKLAAWPTILVVAVIFSGLHFGVSVGTILATLPLGIATGYLRERTGSVRATIAFHMLHNCLALAVTMLQS